MTKTAHTFPRWNWEQPDWPRFVFDGGKILPEEARFLKEGGVVVGTVKHLPEHEREQLTIELLGDEAMTTSEIEGEMLNRESVQSSLRMQLGLGVDSRRVGPGEQGIAELMVDVMRTWSEPLDEAMLFRWHGMVMMGRRDVRDVGRYRTHAEPMQVVSGPIHQSRIHFEAPPSSRVAAEMQEFLRWFEETGPGGSRPMPALSRAGVAHLYFVSIHPFEDGNGRLARAIAEKALAQGLSEPSLTALSKTILLKRRAYYDELEKANKRLEITEWVQWFSRTVIEAQRRTLAQVEFVLEKTRLLDRVGDRLNERQSKVVRRLLREGYEESEGGLSAENYRAISGEGSPATVSRDLAELVELGVLTKRGEKKGTRYELRIGRGSRD